MTTTMTLGPEELWFQASRAGYRLFGDDLPDTAPPATMSSAGSFCVRIGGHSQPAWVRLNGIMLQRGNLLA